MDKSPAISIIIPSYNKASVLAATLQALAEQTIDPTVFEAIVVDDGSTDNTQQLVGSLTGPYPLRFVRQENNGAGSARNTGASLAKGAILLFLDPDIILAPDTLLAHINAQGKYDRTIITGRILPLTPNPFGLEDLFFQTSFDFGTQERCLPWHCTITQCLSIKRTHFYQLGCFAMDLPRGQDIEFGHRAMQAGFEIRYCPDAIGWHNHALEIKQHCQIERRNHQKLVAFFQRYPHLTAEIRYLKYKLPVDWQRDTLSLAARKFVRGSLAWWPIRLIALLTWKAVKGIKLPPQILETLYWSIVGSHQILGLKDGIRVYGPVFPKSRKTR